ncbi:MAG: N-acetylmuramoyl-L-alanine amidase [Polyangiaceae bacterium]
MKRSLAPAVHAIEADLASPRELIPVFPPGFARRTVFLDAGHGAEKNPGNTSCYCVAEQDFTRDLTLEVADYLEETGHFKVVLARSDGRMVGYAERVARATASGADAFVSIHSDVRGDGKPWSPSPGLECLENLDSPGFVVLYSDEGAPALVEARHTLALDVSARMGEAGFLPYTSTYKGLYEIDPEDPSVLLDRHTPDKRIFVLKKTTMPAVLVETHHALDPREARLWEMPTTRRAFAAVLAQALVDATTD